jgi:hypothetical protein
VCVTVLNVNAAAALMLEAHTRALLYIGLIPFIQMYVLMLFIFYVVILGLISTHTKPLPLPLYNNKGERSLLPL